MLSVIVQRECFLDCVNDGRAFVVYSCSMCCQWRHLGKTNASRILRLYCFNGEGERNPTGWLTEWVSSRRVASSPGGAVHVCSFSPALRFESPDTSEVRRPSSFLNSACSLLTSFSSRWSADDNKPSKRIIRDTRVMFNRRVCNFKVGHKLFSSQHTPPHHQKHPHWRPIHRGRWLVGARIISTLIGREESSSAGMSLILWGHTDPWWKNCAKAWRNDFLLDLGDLGFRELFNDSERGKEHKQNTD